MTIIIAAAMMMLSSCTFVICYHTICPLHFKFLEFKDMVTIVIDLVLLPEFHPSSATCNGMQINGF